MRLASRFWRIGVLLALAAACGEEPSAVAPPPGAPASVTIVPNQASLAVGDTIRLVATVRDGSGQAMPNAPLTWSSASAAVASVSASGTVTGVSAGSTTVTATSGAASGTVQADVTVPPAPGDLRMALSSYLGGSQSDVARDVAVDAQGNIYLAGATASPDFPVTAAAYDRTFHTGGAGPMDAFVTKLAPSGAILWSTYVGSPNYERAYALELDPQGAVVIAGRAGAGLPVSATAFQRTFGGGDPNSGYGPEDGFVCKLAATGSALQWCSYFGVGDQGILRDVAVDAAGDIYVAGGTTLGGFPSTWFANAYQPVKGAGSDVIVAKIKGDGSQVLWATYLGGSGDEGAAPSLRLDAQGNVVVAFSTSSRDMPTANAASPTFHGGNLDFFVAKLSPDGHTLLYGTYLGGSGSEDSETHGLWIDAQGNMIVAVQTSSTDAPTTPGAFQRVHGGGGIDAYLVKLSSTGTLLAATFLGGSGSDGVQGVATDAQGNVYVGVTTNSGNFPLTIPGAPGGGMDAVGVEVSADFQRLLFARRFGGSGDEQSRSVIVDPAGDLYLVGQTGSANWPLLNPFQSGFGGVDDGFLVKLTR